MNFKKKSDHKESKIEDQEQPTAQEGLVKQINKVYKFRLYPNKSQEERIA